MKKIDSFLYAPLVRVLFFILNLVAIYFLLRGHYLPGGGFVGGLVSAISLVLLVLATGIEEVYKIIRIDPAQIAFAGLLLAIVSGLIPVFVGDPFWSIIIFICNCLFRKIPLGTPLLFDTGVYLVVIGIASKMIFVIWQSTGGTRLLSDRKRCAILPRWKSLSRMKKGRTIMQIDTAILIGVLFGAGIYLMLNHSFVKILFGIAILSNGANILLLSMSGDPTGKSVPLALPGIVMMVDPLPQALILTAIVIGFGSIAFMVTLLYRLFWITRRRMPKTFTMRNWRAVNDCA